MSNTRLPAWALEPGRQGVHAPEGSYSARTGKLHPRSTLPVYARQLFPERVVGEAPDDRGVTVWENEGVRLWNLPQVDAGIAILSVTSRNHTLGAEVLEGVLQAVAKAEREFDGLVIWHDAPFAVGANLQQVVEACAAGEWDMLEATVEKFQRASQSFKYAQVPTVAAVQGMALGGGCEFLMHASHRVLALESYIGLVEAGVGLIPAGGGSKEFAARAAALAAKTATPGEVFPYLQPVFQTIAMAQVAKSGLEAIEAGLAREHDIVLFHPGELLFVAIGRLHPARAVAERAGRRPQWHRQLRDGAGQHARGRHDQRARLPGGTQRGGCAVRRRGRDRHEGRRGMAAGSGAQGIRGAAAHAGNPGPHPPHP